MMAKELGEPLNRLVYHVRVLREAGVIELDSTRMGRSTVEHLYRSRLKPSVSGPAGEWISITVDETGWAELRQAVEQLVTETRAIERRAATRLAQTDETAAAARLAVLLLDR